MLLALLFAALLGAEETHDVRKVRWGMSKQQVRKVEAWKFLKEKGQDLHYTGVLFEQPCKLIFQFEDDKLWGLQYRFNNSVNSELFNAAFDGIKTKYKKLTQISVKDPGTETWVGANSRTSVYLVGIVRENVSTLGILFSDREREQRNYDQQQEKAKKEADAAF